VQAKAQNAVNEDAIRATAIKWNAIHNSKDIPAFKSLYSSTVLFYGKYTDAGKCINEKAKFLNNSFQEIITPIQIFYYSSGTIRCVFTKRVIYKKSVKEYPSYLLLEKETISM
jgi:hypothetical protein